METNLGKIYSNLLFFDGFSQKKISLIDSKSFENKINCEKFYILSRENEIIKKILTKYKDIEDIYYYERKKDLFILFCDEDKEYQIGNLNNNCWKLIKLSTKNKDILEIFNNNIKKNSIKENIEKKYLAPELLYTEFYLINENWLNSLKKNKTKKNTNKIKINPDKQIIGFNGYSAYNNFRFIETNKKEIMEKIIEEYYEDKNKNIITKKIFFVYGNTDIKDTSKTLYFGIMDTNLNAIYFYLFEKQSYSVDFIIYYNNLNILLDEIKNKIVLKGIEIYLSEMGIDLSKSKEFQELINLDLKPIGNFLNIKLDIKNNIMHSKPLIIVDKSYYFNSVIQCLANINQLKILFLNRAKLKKTIGKKHKMSMIFYKLMQYMWIFKENENNKEEINSINSYILLPDISELSQNENLFKDIKQLIEFILLSMHCEQSLNPNDEEEDEQNINYEINNLKKLSTEINNSFIKNLFFFELQIDDKCCENNYIIDCLLYYSREEIEIIKDQKINIDTILTLKTNYKCKICNKEKNSKFKFKSPPQILIIIFSKEIDYNFNFSYKDKMDLKKYSIEKKSNNYELISLIIKANQGFETYCKSSIENNNWYHYKEGINEQSIDKVILKQNQVLNKPYLLIYKKCK